MGNLPEKKHFISFSVTSALYVKECPARVAWDLVSKFVRGQLAAKRKLPSIIPKAWASIFLEAQRKIDLRTALGRESHKRTLGEGMPLDSFLLNASKGAFSGSELGFLVYFGSLVVLHGRIDYLEGVKEEEQLTNRNEITITHLYDLKFTESRKNYERSWSYKLSRRQLSLYGLMLAARDHDVDQMDATLIVCDNSSHCIKRMPSCLKCEHATKFTGIVDLSLAEKIVDLLTDVFREGITTVLQNTTYQTRKKLCKGCPHREVCGKPINHLVALEVEQELIREQIRRRYPWHRQTGRRSKPKEQRETRKSSPTVSNGISGASRGSTIGREEKRKKAERRKRLESFDNRTNATEEVVDNWIKSEDYRELKNRLRLTDKVIDACDEAIESGNVDIWQFLNDCVLFSSKTKQSKGDSENKGH